ncbi:MAG: NAD(P)H-binding protein [Gemmatimonadetes bacterium]|nr:NAD(P)H-binding protein [Gemmatimonadota bacterium]
MLVALTGATGFVGRHIATLLLKRGHRVRALVRDPGRAPLPAGTTLEWIRGALADRGALQALLAGADAVVHLVGIIAERGTATFAAVHVDGTRSLVEAAQAEGVRRFVYMSAVGARDEVGATLYHRTKARAEAIVRASGLAAAVFRPSIISGPENVPIRLLARLHRLLPAVPVFGDGSFPTQPVWIGDVALAFALAAERPAFTGDYELGGPDRLTYVEFVRAIGRASGQPRPLVHVPLSLMRVAARACDVVPGAPITSDQLQMLVEGSATPANAITSVFGLAPLPFEAGLRRYLGEAGRGKGEG